MRERAETSSVTLAAWPEFRAAQSIRIKRAVFRFIPDPAAQVAALLAGERRLVAPGADREHYRSVFERYQKGAARMAPLEGQ